MNYEITARLCDNPARIANIHNGAISMMRPRPMMQMVMNRSIFLSEMKCKFWPALSEWSGLFCCHNLNKRKCKERSSSDRSGLLDVGTREKRSDG